LLRNFRDVIGYTVCQEIIKTPCPRWRGSSCAYLNCALSTTSAAAAAAAAASSASKASALPYPSASVSLWMPQSNFRKVLYLDRRGTCIFTRRRSPAMPCGARGRQRCPWMRLHPVRGTVQVCMSSRQFPHAGVWAGGARRAADSAEDPPSQLERPSALPGPRLPWRPRQRRPAPQRRLQRAPAPPGVFKPTHRSAVCTKPGALDSRSEGVYGR
jgi:hypothetical protein